MFIVTKNNTILITRSDTPSLTVTLIDSSGNGYSMDAGDNLVLTVKRDCLDDDYVLQKTVTGSNTFAFESSDTSGLDFGKYRYDIELQTASGGIFTVIPSSVFRICEEVG